MCRCRWISRQWSSRLNTLWPAKLRVCCADWARAPALVWPAAAAVRVADWEEAVDSASEGPGPASIALVQAARWAAATAGRAHTVRVEPTPEQRAGVMAPAHDRSA